MTRYAFLAFCALLLASCTGGGALRLLTGGGPNVAANVQAGKTNVQSIGGTSVSDQKLVRPQARTIEQSAGETGVRAEAVQSVTVHNEAPPWVWIIVICSVGLMALSLADEVRDRMERRKAIKERIADIRNGIE